MGFLGDPSVGMMKQGGWDVSTAVYANKSFSAASQDTSAYGSQFNSDGTILYVLGGANDTVYQYTLSTAWDVSTASYASKSFSVATQSTTPLGFCFKPDGSVMYVVTAGVGNVVYQYTLSTPWDVSTASYASKSYNTTTQTETAGGIALSSDGSAMFVSDYGSGAAHVFQYTLSTAWDVSTASYASKTIDVSSEETGFVGIFFKTDGTSFYIGGTNRKIFQYNLSTQWDLSTASYSGKSKDVFSQCTNCAYGISFKNDGSSMYVFDLDDTLHQYTVGG